MRPMPSCFAVEQCLRYDHRIALEHHFLCVHMLRWATSYRMYSRACKAGLTSRASVTLCRRKRYASCCTSCCLQVVVCNCNAAVTQPLFAVTLQSGVGVDSALRTKRTTISILICKPKFGSDFERSCSSARHHR